MSVTTTGIGTANDWNSSSWAHRRRAARRGHDLRRPREPQRRRDVHGDLHDHGARPRRGPTTSISTPTTATPAAPARAPCSRGRARSSSMRPPPRSPSTRRRPRPTRPTRARSTSRSPSARPWPASPPATCRSPGTAGGALVGTVTGAGPTYNVAVTGMTTRGTVVATIGAGVAADLAGNANAASTSTDNTVTWDNVGARRSRSTRPSARPTRPAPARSTLHGHLQRAGHRLRHRRRDVRGHRGRGQDRHRQWRATTYTSPSPA